MTPSIGVLVVDDEELVRDGLVTIVSARRGLKVIGAASTGDRAVAMVAELTPDVVLMDIRMPGIDGIETTRLIVESGSPARILVLTTIETDEVVYAALRAGASGFLLKSVPREQLWLGIESVAAGDALLAPSLTRRLIEDRIASQVGLPRRELNLTERQRDVVCLVARGNSNREIAQQLFLAEATVKGYISEILATQGVRDRTQLAVLAYESGLVQPGQARESGAV